MFFRITWMLVIFGLVVLAQSGLALRCWDCASNTNTLCGDPLNITDHQTLFHTKICETGPYETPKHICRKTVRKGK
ncbi:hypothetical protein K0M31_016149 [Melipona bicolor]|uniref:Protein sleepless n=1 Tax=Melipona bicolor TaxID=60889 RepID=A0AA40G6H4_9HYME|nr:hypothetical protein K0M31_016149 [Melipona bicolor]